MANLVLSKLPTSQWVRLLVAMQQYQVALICGMEIWTFAKLTLLAPPLFLWSFVGDLSYRFLFAKENASPLTVFMSTSAKPILGRGQFVNLTSKANVWSKVSSLMGMSSVPGFSEIFFSCPIIRSCCLVVEGIFVVSDRSKRRINRQGSFSHFPTNFSFISELRWGMVPTFFCHFFFLHVETKRGSEQIDQLFFTCRSICRICKKDERDITKGRTF